jgi:hypothetical protein
MVRNEVILWPKAAALGYEILNLLSPVAENEDFLEPASPGLRESECDRGEKSIFELPGAR